MYGHKLGCRGRTEWKVARCRRGREQWGTWGDQRGSPASVSGGCRKAPEYSSVTPKESRRSARDCPLFRKGLDAGDGEGCLQGYSQAHLAPWRHPEPAPEFTACVQNENPGPWVRIIKPFQTATAKPDTQQGAFGSTKPWVLHRVPTHESSPGGSSNNAKSWRAVTHCVSDMSTRCWARAGTGTSCR